MKGKNLRDSHLNNLEQQYICKDSVSGKCAAVYRTLSQGQVLLSVAPVVVKATGTEDRRVAPRSVRATGTDVYGTLVHLLTRSSCYHRMAGVEYVAWLPVSPGMGFTNVFFHPGDCSFIMLVCQFLIMVESVLLLMHLVVFLRNHCHILSHKAFYFLLRI